jgi:hypothetical protein
MLKEESMSLYAHAVRPLARQGAGIPAAASRLAPLATGLNSRPAVNNAAILSAALNRPFSSAPPPSGGGAGGGLSGFVGRHVYGPHNYSVSHRAFPPGMPEQERFEHLRRNPAPGTSEHSTPEGSTGWIFPFGRIHTIASRETSSVTNTPLFPHVLYPWLGGEANVRRHVEGENIISRGAGHGFFPSLQEAGAHHVWAHVAHRTRMQADPEYRQQQENLNRIQGGESLPGGD